MHEPNDALEIQGAYLSLLDFSYDRSILEDGAQEAMNLGVWPCAVDVSRQMAECTVHVRASASVDESPVFDIHAHYIMRYARDAEIDVDDATIELWLRQVAQIHAWPYFRELFQGITARSELPHLVLPLMVAPNAHPIEVKEQA